jgi:hypothetical protein
MIRGPRNGQITCGDPSVKQRENSEFLSVRSIGFHLAEKFSFEKQGPSKKNVIRPFH